MQSVIPIWLKPLDSSLIYHCFNQPIWVVVSILLLILASYAALTASTRIAKQTTTRSKIHWILITALTLGLGIWAMHFIGMLALSFSSEIYYNPFITIISIVPAISASGIAFGVVKRSGKPLSRLWRSFILAIGIGTMHYIGMAAIHLHSEISYDPFLFGCSFSIGFGLSYLSLTVKEESKTSKKWNNFYVLLMIGLTVSSLHFTAMSSAYLVEDNPTSPHQYGLTNDTIAIFISLTTLFLALSALTLSAVSRNQDITRELRASEERWKFALEGSGDGVWDWDINTDKALFSKRWKEMLGYEENEFPNSSTAWIKHIHEEDKVRVLSILHQYLDGHIQTYSVEFRMLCKNGNYKWILSKGRLINQNSQNNSVRMIGTHTDITESKQVEIDLKIAAIAFESQEGIIITDAKNMILRVNKAFTEISGYSAQEVIGQNPRILSSGHHNRDFYASMWDSLNRNGAWEGEIWNRRKDGRIYPQHLNITAVKDSEGTLSNYVATITDIIMSKEAADEIQRLAFYDPLTGLPNRQLLRDRLKLSMASSFRSQRKGAMLFIDMDNFKTLNDTLGHDIGDLLLQQVAKRLTACVREADTVARLGGDEFVIVLEDLSEIAMDAIMQTEIIANKILMNLNQTYQLNQYECRSTPSIGATLINGHEQTIDELLKQADIAMYQAKTAGRNTFRFFDPEMQASIKARAELEAHMTLALAVNQFVLFYQAQVNHLGQIIGAEALIRWKHPEQGLISPMDFIPLAEETGLILPIGRWVLQTACEQLKLWEKNPYTRNLLLAVNVSPYQFRQSDFIEEVCQIIYSTSINPNKLKLEITESLVHHDIEDNIIKMQALREIGIRFSMDDFGTDYSSLSSLKKLPLDQLKIDKSFVRDITTDPDDAIIVQTIIAMANHLGMEVIAEGVETEAQRAFLKLHGCRICQGYLISKPIPLIDFEKLVEIDNIKQ